jgi:hypothetical protein
MKARYAAALLATAFLLLLLSLSGRKTQPREPSYGGLTLTQWALLNPNSIKSNPRTFYARAAIRTIGTNALPCLLAWLSVDVDRQPIKQCLRRILIDLPNTSLLQPARSWATNDLTLTHFEMAPYIFRTLGTDAVPAIPDLERIAIDPNGPRSASAAISILGGIGPDALAALEHIAHDPKCPQKNEAAQEVARLLDQIRNRSVGSP